MNAIETHGLTKRYPGFTLEGVDLTLPGGCILGLLGENGAGKSTLLRLLIGGLRRDGGSVSLLGQDCDGHLRDLKEEIGMVPDEVGVPDILTPRQLGGIFQDTFRRWDGAEYARLLRQFGIPEKKRFKELSRGMKMKLGLSAALSHGAKLLILDEALNGLDPLAREDALEMLRAFVSDEEHAVLISSHIVSDLEKLCDYVAFLHKGRLVLCEEKDRLLEAHGLLHAGEEEIEKLPREAVVATRTSAFGAEALVRRDLAPGVPLSPVGLEEFFLFTMKGEEER